MALKWKRKKKSENNEPPINIHVTLKTKKEKKGGEIKRWPFTFSKIWTFAESPIRWLKKKKKVHFTIALAEVDWKGKWPERERGGKKGKSRWCQVSLKICLLQAGRWTYCTLLKLGPLVQAFQTGPKPDQPAAFRPIIALFFFCLFPFYVFFVCN